MKQPQSLYTQVLFVKFYQGVQIGSRSGITSLKHEPVDLGYIKKCVLTKTADGILVEMDNEITEVPFNNCAYIRYLKVEKSEDSELDEKKLEEKKSKK